MWYEGFLGLSPWSLVAVTLLMTHVTIVGVTVYLHRYSAHRSLELNAGLKHFFRFWLWLTTAQNTREWTAIHRKHHAKCETVDDPHSPVAHGLKTVLLRGSELYRAEAKVPETLKKYGHNTPDDWVERHLYTGRSALGVSPVRMPTRQPAGASSASGTSRARVVSAASARMGVSHSTCARAPAGCPGLAARACARSSAPIHTA